MKVGGDSGSFAATVVKWQAAQGRNDLPWQNTRDPYRVWLSEIMLQQTQVVTVREYFARFLCRCPDVQALAAASLDEVLALWSGLGYYTRARNLHRCAQQVVSEFGSIFPRSSQALETLPGIGRSTAAAIASLCFGERVAILDANVKRVVTRVQGFDADLAKTSHEKALWEVATQLLPSPAQCQDLFTMQRYTQGMMDLGAMVCLPKKPHCQMCPVQLNCVAHAQGLPEKYPVRTRRLKRSSQSIWLLWATRSDGAVWLNPRPAPGVWGGLYCLPVMDSDAMLRASLPSALQSTVIELPVFMHVLTHKDLYLHPRCVFLEDGNPGDLPGQWFSPSVWPSLGLPAPIRKLLERGPA
ncbi:MAG: A/G-specific adenine glycosylase [Burkholderiales bacterium PBB4]|nr:MAG: A/G-specific adenine glycosylase [Burkholderiales bacterium PBB4]